MRSPLAWPVVVVCFVLATFRVHAALVSGEVHVWETQEITFEAARDYANPYVDVTLWIELNGPGFSRKVYGFWDGGRTFKVRFVLKPNADESENRLSPEIQAIAHSDQIAGISAFVQIVDVIHSVCGVLTPLSRYPSRIQTEHLPRADIDIDHI